MTTKDMDLDCYGENLESSDIENYTRYLDNKLCEVFPSKSSERVYGNFYKIGKPEIHDVFRIAESKGWDIYMNDGFLDVYINHMKSDDYDENEVIGDTEYNPTLPLLEQTDKTKKELIDLFE